MAEEIEPWALEYLHFSLGMLTWGAGGWFTYHGIVAYGVVLMMLGAVVFSIWVACLPEDPED